MENKEGIQWFAYHAPKYSPLIKALDEKQRSDLLLAVDAYAANWEVIELDPMTNLVFLLIKSDVDASVSKIASRKETNRLNALKRWESKDAEVCNCIESNAIACETCTERVEEQNNTIHNNTEDYMGEYKNVLLSDQEYSELLKEFPSGLQNVINRFSAYMAQTGKKYNNHFATIREWAKKDLSKISASADKKPQQAYYTQYKTSSAEALQDSYDMMKAWADGESDGVFSW